MFQDIRISPSVLSADFMHLEDELRSLEEAGADWVHFDVMDGHFVPNISIGIPVLAHMRQTTSLPLDVHLMVSNPLEQLPWFLDIHPDYISIHWEALDSANPYNQAEDIVRMVHDAGVKVGVALKPDTDTAVLDSCIALWDMILVMSVYPGFSGQSFIPESVGRVSAVVDSCKQAGVAPLIQVDGGIGPQTAPMVVRAGADVLVAGNAVFKARDYTEAISSIRNAAACINS